MMVRNTNRLVVAMFCGTLFLGIPALCAAKTAKTCPDCACTWVDAEGKKSENPVPTLVRKGADEKNDFNFGYEVKSDPDAKKKCAGKTCSCRIIVRTTEVIKGEKRETDLVRPAGRGEGSYRQGSFKKADAEAKKRGGKVELIPACSMLGEDGEPEYGQPHQ